MPLWEVCSTEGCLTNWSDWSGCTTSMWCLQWTLSWFSLHTCKVCLCVSLWMQVWTGSTMNICRSGAHDCTLYYSPLIDHVWWYSLVVWQMDLFKAQKSVRLLWRSARSVRCRGRKCSTVIDFSHGNTCKHPVTVSHFLVLSLSISLCVCLRHCQTSSETHCSAGNALTIQTAGLYTLDLTL